MRLSRYVLIVGLCLLCFTPPSFGWGGTGHQIVCLIAEDHLTDNAKAGIRELLGDAQISDAEVANWADEIRRQRSNTGPWHYVNIPVAAAGLDRERDGRDGNNIVDAIEKQAKILGDTTASKDARTEALKFLVHLVGDIHQPLHCAERNGDRGGNAQLVFYPGQRRAENLHVVWDTLLLRDAMQRRRVAEYADLLVKRITKKQQTDWVAGTPETWANESHSVARNNSYAGVPANEPPPHLEQRYVEKNKKVVEEQLQRAAIRLASLLNRIFSPRRTP